MSVIKVSDAVFARVAAPDLDAMEAFLTSVGLVRSERTATRLYMRGTDPDPYLHITELGDPRVLGLGFKVSSDADLERLGRETGASVDSLDEPGGGRRVRLTDPNGFLVDVVRVDTPPAPIEVPALATNTAQAPAARQGRGPWRPDRPPQVKRFGHAVLRTPRFAESIAWYQHHLGLECSDQIVDSDGAVIGSFNRIDRGEDFVDHHALLISRKEACGWHHISYEVQHWSEVFEGAAYIKKAGRYKVWRPPVRHFLGGQVGAYVADPWGRIVEFWSDGDRMNSAHQGRNWTVADIETLGPEWEPAPEPGFRDVLSV